MEIRKELAAQCGLYCGACGMYFAHKTNDTKLKERLTSVYEVTVDEMQCEGCCPIGKLPTVRPVR